MSVPEAGLTRARRWYEARIPWQLRNEMGIELEVRGQPLAEIECRPQREAGVRLRVQPQCDCTLPPRRGSGLWAQFWRDRNVRFHRDMLCPPSPHLATPLDEVSADPTGIFWG